MNGTDFVMWTGESGFYWMTRDFRWSARRGNYGCMVLRDRVKDKLHIVGGRLVAVDDKVVGYNTDPDAGMPDVERRVAELLAAEKGGG